MLCEKCNENEATIHYTEIINGHRNEHHLCSLCASKLDFSGMVNLSAAEFPFVKLLTGLLSAATDNEEAQDSPMRHICCPNCGMSFDEFVDVGKFGCSDCVDVFGPLIQENIKRIHGDTVHRGKRYVEDDAFDENTESAEFDKTDEKGKDKKNDAQEINVLKAKLAEAVELEDFEEAARLRDIIKGIDN